MKDALKKAEELFVDYNIFKPEHRDSLEKLEKLPASCWESAGSLEKNREYFEKNNIFPKGTIDSIIHKLRSYNDKDLSEKLYGKHDEIRKLVNDFLHCR